VTVAEELTMPRLSDTMERGTIARWARHEGDAYATGDVLAEIETDKALMELLAYDDGVLLQILVGEGESADLGAPIAVVGAPGEEAPPRRDTGDGAVGAIPSEEPEPSPADSGEPGPPEVAVSAPAAVAAPAAPAAAPSGELRASPVARRMAADAGLDLRPLAGQGSGPDGRIVRVDVERALAGAAPAPAPATTAPAAALAPAAPAPAPADGELVEASPMLKTVARRMAEAKATVPHFYLSVEIETDRLAEVRAELNHGLAADGVKVTVNDFVVRAAALALMENPQFRRSWADGKLQLHSSASIGIAVALDDGLIVPVLRDAQTKSLRQVAVEARDLVGRAREGKLRQREIEGGTFTVSNLGMLGISTFAAIINPPEPGILAVGAAERRPVVVEGPEGERIEPRSVMTATLSVDHRASSGADGARLLASIKRRLEQPLLLLAE
jgi:pyruvate dehydrogenase E2 component (dihydrolipoamide acetyltransferase)